jgi:hypothetical protein
MDEANRRRWGRARVALLVGLLLAGCAGAKDTSGPVVLEIEGNRLTRDDIRWAFDQKSQPGAFESATPEQRKEFLETVGEKEVLLALAREQKYTLTPLEQIQIQDTRDGLLVKALERHVTRPFMGDSTVRFYLKRIGRQNHLLMFMHPADSIAAIARKEVESGVPFGDVVLKYAVDDSLRARKGDVGWITAATLGRDFAKELYIDEREPGYLSQIHRSPSAAVFYKLLGSRDFDYSGNQFLTKNIPDLAQGIRNYDGMLAYIDSLRTATDLKIADSTIPVLMKGMNAYWDSLQAVVKATGRRPDSFRPPVWKFDAAERALPLYRARGKDVTIAEYLKGLNYVVPRLWPMGTKMESVRRQVEYRAVQLLQIDEARVLGLDRQPDLIREAKAEEEKLILGGFYQKNLAKDVKVTPEEVKAYYDKNIEKYRKTEMMRLSYVVFPTKAEAEAFRTSALDKSLDWWSDRLREIKKKRPDCRVMYNSPNYDLSAAVPDTVQGAVKAGWDFNAGEFAPVAPELNGHWMVPRVTYRVRAGITPLEKVDKSIEGVLADEKIGQRVDAMVKDGKTRFGLKLYPERLEVKG